MRQKIPAIIITVAVLLLAAVAAVASGPNPAPVTQALTRSCVTDGGGYCTVQHTLGVVPEAVVLTPIVNAGSTHYSMNAVTGSFTATSVRVRAMRASGTAHANVAITFSMLVLGSPPATTTAPTTTTTVAPTTTTPPVTTTTTTPPPAGCALPAYPDATCTGVPAGTPLTVMTGDMSITQAGTVLDGKDIRGCVEVHAVNVVIRNSKISCAGFYVILSHTDASLTLEDSEVDCQDTRRTAVGDTNLTVRRVNIHGCENGFDLDGNVVIEDSYVHDLYSDDIAHTDGAQLTDIANNITIRHNAIYSRTSDGLDGVDGTSSIISPRVSAGVATNVLIENNLFGGGAYTLYCPQAGPGNNYRVINNHFSTRWHPTVGFYGPWTDCQDEADGGGQVTGNVYHESGLPVPF